MNLRSTAATALILLGGCTSPGDDGPSPPPAPPLSPSESAVLPEPAPPRPVRIEVDATVDGRSVSSERDGVVTVTLGLDAPPVRVVRVEDPIGTLDLERVSGDVFAIVEGERWAVSQDVSDQADCDMLRVERTWSADDGLSATSITDALQVCGGVLMGRARTTRFPLGERVEGWSSAE